MDTNATDKTIEDLVEDRKGIISDAVDSLTADKIKLNRMAEKVRKLVGDEFLFLLFLASAAPRVGDTLEVGDLIATFKKKKR